MNESKFSSITELTTHALHCTDTTTPLSLPAQQRVHSTYLSSSGAVSWHSPFPENLLFARIDAEMRSSFFLIVRVAIFLVASDRAVVGWDENNDTMDYAIGIHFDGKKDNVSTLVEFINELAKRFLETGRARMAIVEFGQHPDRGDVLLSIRDGATPENVAEAAKKIGQGLSYDVNHSIPTMANWTRNLIFSTELVERIHVPKLVTLVVAERRVRHNAKSCESLPQLSEATHSLTHIMVVEDYVKKFRDWQSAFTYGITFLDSNNPKEVCEYKQWKNAEELASSVTMLVKSSLQLCVYTTSTSGCYENQNKECVANVTYELAYRRHGTVTPNWEVVRLYCFKNGSTTNCTGEQCISSTRVFAPTPTESVPTPTEPEPTASTSATIYKDPSMRDDEEYYYDDDPYVINLKRALFGLGIAVAIGIPVDIFLLLRACGIRRQEVARQKLLGRRASPSSDTSISEKTVTRRAWSFSMPPELSTTPADVLVKQYARKKK